MKISVITPCFNASETLEEACRSVLSQQGVDFEMLLVDDGSTDGTRELIRSLAAEDDRIVPLIGEENAGVSNARNRALDVAIGDFVFFLDADDKLRPECLATLSESVVDDKIDFVRGKHEFWWTPPGIIQRNLGEESNFVEVQALAPAAYPQLVAAYSSWNALFRRSMIEAADLRFNETMQLGEDRDFNLRFFQLARRVTFLNAYTYLWRKDYGRSKQATKRLVQDSVQVFTNALNFARLAMRPWFVENPRHAVYLRSAMVVETMNLLMGSASELRDGTFESAAKAVVSDIFTVIPAGGVDIRIPAIKGWSEVYLPLYELAARHLGGPVGEHFFSELRVVIDAVRHSPAQWIVSDPRTATRTASALGIIYDAFCAAASRRGSAGQKEEIVVLRSHTLFDRAYYKEAHPDVADAGIDEIEHFVYYGAAELRNPNAWFNTGEYVKAHPELLVTGVNPLVHFAMTKPFALGWRH